MDCPHSSLIFDKKSAMTVFIVEDDDGFRKLLRKAIGEDREGLTLTFFEDGVDIIDQLLSGDALPDLILSDIKMPHGNGFDVLEFVKQDPVMEHIPVVALTSSTEAADASRAYSLGVDGYVLKPSSSKDIPNTLDTIALLIEKFRKKNKR